MDDLALPPVFDFGSVPSVKHQALRLEFVANDETSTTMVNILCKTRVECDFDGVGIDENRSSVALDRLVSHVHSLKLRRTAKLGIVVLETRTEWKEKIVLALRKLFFLIGNLPIVHLEVGAVHWSFFSELRMDLYSTFKSINELVFLPDQKPEVGDHNAEKLDYHRTALLEWLPRVKGTLRCLRVFTFLKLDSELEEVVEKCTKLNTLTIGKLYSYRDNPEFNYLHHVDFDGQNMAFSSDDLRLAKKVRAVFPSARIFRVVRFGAEILKALLQTLIVAGGVFHVYSDLVEMTHLRHIVGDTLEMEVIEAHPSNPSAYVELEGRNSRFSTTIHFYNHRQRRFIE